MAKLVLPTLAAGSMDVEQINSAFRQLESILDTLVSRDGALPNSMQADLDMSSNRLVNLPQATNATEPVTLGQLDGLTSGYVRQSVDTVQTVPLQTAITFPNIQYVPGSNNLAVFDNGVRLFEGDGYNEVAGATSNQIVLTVSMGSIRKITAVVNEYLGTIAISNATVPWANLTGLPAYATRWPTYAEVTEKPSTFAPSAHTHPASDIVSGGLADAQRRVYVQASAPSSPDIGTLWIY